MLMKEMNFVDYQKEIERTHAMILPVGAFEVWGPHLPLGADCLTAEDISERISKRVGWVVGPSVPVGCSESLFHPKGGTITVRAESLKNYVLDIMENLIEVGVNRFCIVGPHAGNVATLSDIGTHLRRTRGIKTCLIDWWRFIQPICDDNDLLKHKGRMAHAHASEAGTSTFLYIRPDLVKMDRAVEVPLIKNDYPDIPVFTPFVENYPDAHVADPTCATREKGEKIVEMAVDRVVEFLSQWK